MPETTTNWVSRITLFFLNRRSLVLVLLLLVILGGAISLFGLRREGFPKVPVKIVVISTIYKGAAAAEIEQSVTNPIESAIKDVRDVKSIESNSGESVSTVIATLNENSDVNSSLQNITTKVSGVTLPSEADKPNITQPTTGSSAFIFGLTGDKTYGQLLEQGQIFEREIEQIKGIKQVTLSSEVTDRVLVMFDPAKLAAAGVDPTTIQSAIAAGNLNLPAGSELTIDGSRATALIIGRNKDIAELGATPLPTLNGGSVALSSVATITREADQKGTINRIGAAESGLVVARPGLAYNVDIRTDADILSVDKELTATIERLKSNGTLAADLHLVRLYDDAASTTNQINEIKGGAIGEKWEGIGSAGYAGYLLGGIWLLMIAMFLFVNLRTALIAGLAIPLSFCFTLIVLYLSGITLNTLTLFSMILILGLVVDPAIVVLESIQRHKDMGYSGREGVMRAVSSIGQGLVIATICAIIVFLPFGIVSGVFGEIIKYIPVTVIPALIASFFVPLIFLAPIASRFMKAHAHPGRKDDQEQTLWAVSRWFKRANLTILRHVWLQIPIILIAIAAPLAITYYLFSTEKVKSAQFSSPTDTTQALVSVSYPANYTAAQADKLARDTEDVLSRHFEIDNYYYMTQTKTGFTVYINLTPVNERTRTATELVGLIEKDLPSDSAKQIYSSASPLSAGPPKTEFPIQIEIYESDLAKLKAFTLSLAEHARTTDGVIRVSDGYTDQSTTAIGIQINKSAAAARGLNPATIGGQVSGLLGEQTLTKLNLESSTVDVIGGYQGADSYTSVEKLKSLPIATPTGVVPLGSLATFTTDATSGTISHQNGLRYATVRAQVDSETNPYVVQKELNDWAQSQLAAAGLRPDALESKGEGDDIAKSFTNLFAALGVAILLIYLTLALFFGSFLKPIIITFALPLSFLGVFPALAVLGTEFGFLEIIGLITLAGIVVNVGIFVIDYANHRVAAGVPVKEAIAEATAVRFRPIFLTKVVAFGSLLPLAILSPFWRSLATVIIAGILTSGVLSLFTTPILYTWFSKLSDFGNRLTAKFSRKHPTSASTTRPESPQAPQAADPSA